MSEVAGRLAVQAGAPFLERRAAAGGSCSAAWPACAAGNVTIIGGGIVGDQCGGWSPSGCRRT